MRKTVMSVDDAKLWSVPLGPGPERVASVVFVQTFDSELLEGRSIDLDELSTDGAVAVRASIKRHFNDIYFQTAPTSGEQQKLWKNRLEFALVQKIIVCKNLD